MIESAYRAPQKSEVYQSKDGSWYIPPPLRQSREMIYNFTGLGGKVRAIMHDRPDMSDNERAELAYTTMRLAYEHIMSRVIMALETDKELLANPPQTLVISGGVASSRFLRHVAASMLQAHGFDNMTVTAPKPNLCADNAQMIAWAGLKMYEAGWTTEKSFLPQGEWPIEEIITGVDCWLWNGSAVGQREVKAESVESTEEKSSEIKSKSVDEKPSVRPDPGPSSSQDGQHAPASEGPGSPQEEIARTRPSQATDGPAHSGGSPQAPTRRRIGAGARQHRERRAIVDSDHPLHYLQEAEDKILQSMTRPAGGSPTKRESERESTDDDASWRNEQALRAFVTLQTFPDGNLAPKPQSRTPEKPLRIPSSKSTGERKPLGITSTRSTGETKRVHDGAKPVPSRSGEANKEVEGTVKHEEEKREKRFVRLLPPAPAPAPAPAENQAPEGSLQTGLNRLKRWIGL